MHEIASLLHFDRFQRVVQVYDPVAKSCYTPSLEELPWPITWLLGRHSPKHITVSKALPSYKSLASDLDCFQNRMRWRCVYRNSTHKNSILIRYPRAVPPCDEPVPDDLNFWLTRFRSKVLGEFQREMRSQHGIRKFTNQSPLFKWAWSLLRRGDWLPLKKDKDGGFVVVKRECYTAMVLENFDKQMYAPCDYFD